MAPYLLLGIVVAGAMHIFIPMALVARHLGKPGLGSVFKAALLGVPLPICSCGVVPVAASLKKSGASKGAVAGFLITTPTSGVDSILATYSLLGGALTVIRVLAAFLIGLGAGIVTSLSDRKDEAEPSKSPAAESANGGAKGNPIMVGMAYGFGELLGGIARPLLIGTLLGGLIAYALPAGVLEKYVGQGFLSYLMMLVVGIPLYVCASGSIPLAAALMLKGISPGAALVFLLAGPATNAATVTMVSGMLGRRALVIYLLFLTVGSLAAGAAADAFFSAVPSLMPAISPAALHGMGGLSGFEITMGISLGLLALYHITRQVQTFFRRAPKNDSGAYILKVRDMTCQHCVNTITGAVTGLPGVKGISADPKTKLVSLELEHEGDADKAVKAIEDAGYHPEKPE